MKRKSVLKIAPMLGFYRFKTLNYTLGGYKWFSKKSDPDFYTPSCPHLHCCEDISIKLNVYTRQFWDNSNKCYIQKFISPKEQKKLWKDESFLILVYQKRSDFRKEFPHIKLDPIPSFALKDYERVKKQKQRIRFLKINILSFWERGR